MNFKKNIARAMTAAVVLGTIASSSPAAFAAGITSPKDTMTRIQAGAVATTHVLTMTVPALTNGEAITFDYSAAGFATLVETADVSGGGATGITGAIVSDDVVLTCSTGCTGGAISYSFTTATNPSAGSHEIAITSTGSTTGSMAVTTVADDTITVTATVSPSITFDVGTQTTPCVYNSLANVYTVSLGTLSSATVTTSLDQAGTGTTGVEGICVQLDTNASNGAIVTVKSDAPGASAEGGLVSSSVTTDFLPANTGGIAAGTSEFGICLNYISSADTTPNSVFTNDGNWGDASLVGSETSATSANCAGGANTTSTALTGAVQNVLTSGSDAVGSGLARILVKAAISGTQPAHNDYTTDLTFVATATF